MTRQLFYHYMNNINKNSYELEDLVKQFSFREDQAFYSSAFLDQYKLTPIYIYLEYPQIAFRLKNGRYKIEKIHSHIPLYRWMPINGYEEYFIYSYEDCENLRTAQREGKCK